MPFPSIKRIPVHSAFLFFFIKYNHQNTFNLIIQTNNGVFNELFKSKLCLSDNLYLTSQD